ncbi:hypothetical protein [Enterovibrio norvegicus]|uniref:hypothetical protein n=1 Tax=Enterovibrio norvegicus TaxID=188144 RepID=UPI000C81E943|nr:hypothetical protein [Enterovibrio norvegicus]PML79162.1 hypothetical protein BCT69_14335 [Enterovibrio norvegicus]
MDTLIKVVLLCPLFLVGCDCEDKKGGIFGSSCSKSPSTPSEETGPLSAFNLTSIEAVAGQSKTLIFSWEPSENAESYTLCRKNTALENNCESLSSEITTTQHTITLSEVMVPNLLSDDFFILAMNSTNKLAGSEGNIDFNTYSELTSYIKASTIGDGDRFGGSVTISADGQTLAIGAYYEDSSDANDETNNSASNSGAVYIFTLSNNVWVQQSYLKANNVDVDDEFGVRLSLDANGQTLAVGVPDEDSADQTTPLDNTDTESGAVYIFERSGDSWAQTAYLKASNAEQDDLFGMAVSLSADGETLAVGSIGEDSNDPNNSSDNAAPSSGAVYVFTSSSGVWSETAYLKASNLDSSDSFGSVVALSDDGQVMLVTSPYEASGDPNDASNDTLVASGAAYIFTRSGNAWSEQGYLKASNLEFIDIYGFRGAISGDGETFVVTTTEEDSEDPNDENNNNASSSGAAYVYTVSGGVWSQQAYLKAQDPDVGDFFGSSVDITTDGDRITIGAIGDKSTVFNDPTDNSGATNGAVYVFARSGNIWSQEAFIKANVIDTDDQVGVSVSLSGDGNTLVFGSMLEDSADADDQTNNAFDTAGAVYIF